jgi:DNA excision repair protein ERCC-8
MQFSDAKSISSDHHGAILWMDLDPVEHRYLLACAADASIAAYDTLKPSDNATHDHAPLFVVQKGANGHQSAVSCVGWYPIDTGLFISGGRDEKVHVWDANVVESVSNLNIMAPVHCIAMSQAATSHCLVAVGSESSDVMLCDMMAMGFKQYVLPGHRGGVWAMAWSPRLEHELVTGDRGGQMRLWDMRYATVPVHAFDMQHTVAQVREDREPHGFADVALPVAGRQQRGQQAKRSNAFSQAHSQGITGIVPTPDGLYWISAGNDDQIRLWDAASHRNMLVNYPNAFNRASKPRQISVAEGGDAVFHPSGSALQIFDTQGGRQIKVLSGGHFESVNACVWNSLTQELYSGGGDRAILTWAPSFLAKPSGALDGSEINSESCWSD